MVLFRLALPISSQISIVRHEWHLLSLWTFHFISFQWENTQIIFGNVQNKTIFICRRLPYFSNKMKNVNGWNEAKRPNAMRKKKASERRKYKYSISPPTLFTKQLTLRYTLKLYKYVSISDNLYTKFTENNFFNFITNIPKARKRSQYTPKWNRRQHKGLHMRFAVCCTNNWKWYHVLGLIEHHFQCLWHAFSRILNLPLCWTDSALQTPSYCGCSFCNAKSIFCFWKIVNRIDGGAIWKISFNCHN